MGEATEDTYIIAEIANAHQGDVSTLLGLIEAAAASKAQAVKVQWFRYDFLATPDYEWYDAYRKLFFESEVWERALSLARDLGLAVWVDIFDEWGMELARTLRDRIAGVKLPPTILEDDAMARSILDLGLPTLVGVGGWTESQIAGRFKFLRRYARGRMTLMHGFQGYPTSIDDCNLLRIPHYSRRYKCRIGIADHVDGGTQESVDLPAHAVCLGARVVEKHLTLDRSLKGYDYFSSLEPARFSEMVKKVRAAERMLGGMDRSQNEINYLSAVPRAVLRSPKPSGALVSIDDVDYRRTGTLAALTPAESRSHLPAILKRDISAGEAVTANDIRKPKIVIAVICRLKSTRLKRKALAPIAGIPSALRCLRRCTQARRADEVFLATSHLKDDDDLLPIATEANVGVVRGDPESVLGRLLQVADESHADIVVRVTGDCPVISPEVLDYLIERHLNTNAEFTTLTGKYPIGIAGDVFSTSALRRLASSDADLSLSEYLRYYFEWNDGLFQCELPKPPTKWRRDYRLTLDVQDDLDMFERMYAELEKAGRADSLVNIIELLDGNPEIGAINAHVGLVYKTDQALIARIRSATSITQIPPRHSES